METFPLFPPQASNFAGPIDLLYGLMVLLSIVFAGLLPFVILYLVVKYHRSMKADRSNPPEGNVRLEIAWSVIPLVLMLAVFFWGAYLYVQMRTPPAQTLEVYVIGKQWMWHVQHPNGKRENNELHVPVGQPVKLIMTSQDVIHSFYIPAFRVKQDVLPGRYTTMWFEPTLEGEYHLFCAEYCGTEHSKMIGRVTAMSLAEYQRWLDTTGPILLPDGSEGVSAPITVPDGGDPLAAAGAQIFTEKGCASCHRDDGAGQGPSMVGLFGNQERFADGTTAVADENYLRESILNPTAKVVEGYQPIMPPYQGQLTDDEILQLIAYIKSLSDGGSGN
jgi:cytochrome c oxidase subunit II